MTPTTTNYLQHKFGSAADLIFPFADALRIHAVTVEQLEEVARTIPVENTTTVSPQVNNILTELTYAVQEASKDTSKSATTTQDTQDRPLESLLGGLSGLLGGAGTGQGSPLANLSTSGANPLETLQNLPKLLSVAKAMHTEEGHKAFYDLFVNIAGNTSK